jgi:hypothetical protein
MTMEDSADLNQTLEAVDVCFAALGADVHTALTHAIRCGRMLRLARKQIGHDGWNSWVRENCEFSVEKAKCYMSVSRRAHKLGWNESSPLPFEEAWALMEELDLELPAGEEGKA